MIDYKTRPHRAVRKAAADPGEDVQLPLYALALGPANIAASYLSFERSSEADRGTAATVQRFPAAEPLELWVRLVGDRLRRDLASVAAGAGLAALGSASTTCVHCEMRGLCRRDEWSADG